jgi:hypothetical protein
MLDLTKKLFDFIQHIDVHLKEISANYGLWTDGVLFMIICCGNRPGGASAPSG